MDETWKGLQKDKCLWFFSSPAGLAWKICPAPCSITDLVNSVSVGLLWEEKNQGWAPS